MTSKDKSSTETLIGPYVAEFFKVWLTKYQSVSSHTVRSYMGSFKSFNAYMQSAYGIRARDITFEVLDEDLLLGFLDWLKASGLKESTCNTRLGALKSFAKFIEYKSVPNIDFCCTIGRIRTRSIDSGVIDFLEREAIQALFDAAASRNLREQTILEMLYDTGARSSELVGIQLRHVVFPEGKSRASIELHGKGNKSRVIKISKQVTKTLKLYIKRYTPDPDGPLFFNRSGNPLSTGGVSYIVSRCEEVAKANHLELFAFRVHPHTFRHSIATHMVRAGVNLETVRLFLGHSSSATTLIYAKTDPETVSDAIEIVHEGLIRNVGIANSSKRDELDSWLNEVFLCDCA